MYYLYFNKQTQKLSIMKTSIYTKKGEIRTNIEKAIRLIAFSKQSKKHVFIYPKSWTRSKLIDKTEDILTLLNHLKIRSFSGNSSPRGGQEGDYLRITRKSYERIVNTLA